MAKITRGFVGRRLPNRDGRLPPGQYDVGDEWPVLTAEVTPRLATSTWTFTVEGLVDRPMTWTWDEIHALPGSAYSGDIHCVTTWSKFDVTFGGVSLDTLLEIARPLPTATHVLAFCHTGYTTNLPLADVTGGQAWVAWDSDGRPLPVEHGGPARLLVPSGRSALRHPAHRSRRLHRVAVLLRRVGARRVAGIRAHRGAARGRRGVDVSARRGRTRRRARSPGSDRQVVRLGCR